MQSQLPPRRAPRPVSLLRALLGAFVVYVLIRTYLDGFDRGVTSPFDFFGYFTNLTSLLTAVLLLVIGINGLRGLAPGPLLTGARAVAVSCMIVVGIVYNTLVPGTGSAPPWVSALLHLVFPLAVLLDWLLVGDRPPLSWTRFWTLLPYPVVWLAVVLVRGATDGWVPYGFLLPENGPLSLVAHIAGLLAALLASGCLVWLASRWRGSTRVTRCRSSRRGCP